MHLSNPQSLSMKAICLSKEAAAVRKLGPATGPQRRGGIFYILKSGGGVDVKEAGEGRIAVWGRERVGGDLPARPEHSECTLGRKTICFRSKEKATRGWKKKDPKIIRGRGAMII